MPDLWVLQAKTKPEDYWVDVTMPVPLAEIERYVNNTLPVHTLHNRQHFYRAFCTTDERMENKNWQALPDFPDMATWVEVGTKARMKDGTVWQKV